MNDTTVKVVQATWFEKLPPLRLWSCCSILSAAMLVVYFPVAVIAFTLRGPNAVWAAAIAAIACVLGSNLALVATAVFGRRGVNGPLYTMLFGLVFNGALPFLAGFVLYRLGGPLAEAGVFGLTVLFLQFSLLIETVLALCLLKPSHD